MSDASNLFTLLFGLPALFFAIVFAAVALRAPRGGAVLSGMLFASVVPVVFWARSAGYLGGSGAFLLAALAISGLGVLVGAIKLLFHKAKPP
jgi:ABC-type transport system involved in cytochrome c biogenesis permease component